MTTAFTKFVSAVTAFAFIATLVPASAFAEGETLTTGDPVETVAPITDTADTTTTSDTAAPLAAESVSSAPLATNDGGTFDSFTNGSVNGQGGWTADDTTLDESIVDNTTGPSSFGLKALRISNAKTSGGFGQMYAPMLATPVGEAAATPTGGARDNHFEMSFDFISAIPNFEQPGLAMTLSPDRGDGSRMSYVKLSDTAAGIDVDFYDVQGTGNPADFEDTTVATGLDRTVPHNIKLTFDAVEGPSNDVVKVYVDGVLVHTGTSWENYYRYDSEANADQHPRAIKTVLFRINGTAAPATSGKGFLFDHFTTAAASLPVTPAPTATTVVRAADLGTARTASSSNWFFYNDATDVVDNTLGSFVAGPDTAPLGTGSAQMTATSTQKVALGTTGKSGTRLADITALQYSSYRSAGDPALAPTLQFDFDNDLNAANPYLGRLVYEPYFTQTVNTGTWQTWDTLNDAAGTGTGNWWFSGATSPSKVAFAPNLANCTQSNPCTWAEVKAAFPQGAIANGGLLALRTGGWSSTFTGNVDDVVFGTYAGTETIDFDNDVVVPPVVTSGGGSGGRRSGSGGRVITTTGGTTTTTTGGQVLGAAAFNFTVDLHIGSRGTDVTELQTELIAAGYSIPAGATGYFGVQTRAAVAAWQAANGVLPSAGYFGPISRAKYLANDGFGKAVVPVTTTTTTSTTTASTTTATTTASH